MKGNCWSGTKIALDYAMKQKKEIIGFATPKRIASAEKAPFHLHNPLYLRLIFRPKYVIIIIGCSNVRENDEVGGNYDIS